MKKFILVLTVLVLSGCSSTKEPEALVKSEYAIGEVAETKDLKITVNSTRLLEGEEYLKPQEGESWIAIDMTFENTGKESEYIGGILELSLKDGEGRSKDYNIFGDTNGSLDANVLAGEKISGEVSFVIKEGETDLYLYYAPSFSTTDPIKFVIK